MNKWEINAAISCQNFPIDINTNTLTATVTWLAQYSAKMGKQYYDELSKLIHQHQHAHTLNCGSSSLAHIVLGNVGKSCR